MPKLRDFSKRSIREYLNEGKPLRDLTVKELRKILNLFQVKPPAHMLKLGLVGMLESHLQKKREDVDKILAAAEPSDVGIEDCTSRSRKPSSTTTSQKGADQTLPQKSPKLPQPRIPISQLQIPVDDHSGRSGSHKVYIDNGTIFDALLNKTDSTKNCNRFYRVQLLMPRDSNQSAVDFCTWTRWGRVGENGRGGFLDHPGGFRGALGKFREKFKDKTGHEWEDRAQTAKEGKYACLEINYRGQADNSSSRPTPSQVQKECPQDPQPPAESKLPGSVQHLMGLIFNKLHFNESMASFKYNANKVPLGSLSKQTLDRGYEKLKELTTAINNNTVDVEQLSNAYLTLIPHDFRRGPVPVICTIEQIKREIELLENLTNMKLAVGLMELVQAGTVNPIDRQYQCLGMQEITPLDAKAQEFIELQDYLQESKGETHHLEYTVRNIFRIERNEEAKRLEKSQYAKVINKDRRLLWHGSRCTNFAGILRNGLCIAPPEAPVSGYMFGKGVYFADISTKSANYCAADTSGGVGLLLLCEVELGKPRLELETGNPDAPNLARKSNCISTLGVGRTVPVAWKDAGCVHSSLKGVSMPDVSKSTQLSRKESKLQYNEYIVYNVAQIRLRYLLRVEITGGR